MRDLRTIQSLEGKMTEMERKKAEMAAKIKSGATKGRKK